MGESPFHQVEVTVSAAPPAAPLRKETAQEGYYTASQWQLMWRRFRRNRLAAVGGVVIALFYFVAILCEFLAPYTPDARNAVYRYCPPQRMHWIDKGNGFVVRPFVYGLKSTRDPRTMMKTYAEDRTKVYPVKFFQHGLPYRMWGLFGANLHLASVESPGALYLLGTDSLGRDLLTRLLYATRISLSVGLVGVTMSFLLGCTLGGVSGYYGGAVDTLTQRIIEFFLAIPTIPLWMGLAAALPSNWSPVKTYFAITVILSLLNWTYLARVVRGKLLSLREEDFVTAALIAGARKRYVIARHLLPSFMSYLIVSLTLAVPNMILGETALSFLGIGLQAPVVSWGVLLKDAQNVQTVALYPWLMLPVLAVIITVLCFNFLGDGLRDAADPYTYR